MAFNANAFVSTFDNVLETLANSEKITKAVLQTLSRDLLELLHTKNPKQGDIGYINRTIAVLTPVNRKVFIEFNKEFTGFILSKAGNVFEKKAKKHYDDVALKALVWLEDPMNNIWSWADRNVEIVAKEFTLDVVKKNMETMFKKADKSGINRLDVITTILQAGITVDELVQAMEKAGELADVVENIEKNYDQQ
jgi:hypothetical protein